MSKIKLTVPKEVVAEYKKFSKGEKYCFILKVNKEATAVELAEDTTSVSNLQELLKVLPENEPRYIYLSFDYEITDGKRNKSVLIFYTPKKSRVREKMIYSSAISHMKKKCHAQISHHVFAAHDFDHEEIKEKCCRFSQ